MQVSYRPAGFVPVCYRGAVCVEVCMANAEDSPESPRLDGCHCGSESWRERDGACTW